MRGDVAGISLEADSQSLEIGPGPRRKSGKILLSAKGREEAALAFKLLMRAFIAPRGELGCEDTILSRAADMQALHHGALPLISELHETSRHGRRETEG